jgi:hypothetical protein
VSPLDVLFWLLPANFVVHVLDETLMNGGFVAKVRQYWWPEYNSLMFSWFNTVAMAAFVASVLLYEIFGGHWVILPVLFVAERWFHGFVFHIWWTVKYREYSPGLVSCVLAWILGYLVTRAGLLAGSIARVDFVIGGLIGFVASIVLALSPTVIFPGRAARKAGRRPPR